MNFSTGWGGGPYNTGIYTLDNDVRYLLVDLIIFLFYL